MITILTVFALPVATIILAIVLEKILRCPFLTALTFFAIYLIVAFTAFDSSFLVFAIIYTILVFITAYVTEFILRRCRNLNNTNDIRLTTREINAIANEVINLQNNSNCSCNQNTNTLGVTVRDTQNGNRTSWCCYRR